MATLLIVDDDSLVRENLHELLSASHECHTADRAEQALAYLDIETYDVVLTDLAMPRLSGRDLLSHIQTKHPMTPVIVISAMFEEEDAREFIVAGAFANLAKHCNLTEYKAEVVRAIGRSQDYVSQRYAKR